VCVGGRSGVRVYVSECVDRVGGDGWRDRLGRVRRCVCVFQYSQRLQFVQKNNMKQKINRTEQNREEGGKDSTKEEE
jgi:hypothetical protein